MDADAIIQVAGDKLQAQGIKRELSAQAKAVIEAICDAIIERDEKPLVLVRQVNAVNKTPTGRMKKPTVEEVVEHAAKIELPESEARKFWDFYESKGWKVGKQPMRLWTAAMSNWKRGWKERSGTQSVSPSVESIRNQTALIRVEDRMKVLRGLFPLAQSDAYF